MNVCTKYHSRSSNFVEIFQSGTKRRTNKKTDIDTPSTTSLVWLRTHSHSYCYLYLYTGICLLKSPMFHFSSFHPSFLQVVKDRVCLRALEKMIYQLVDSKEQAEILSATALQPLDVNADGTHANLMTVCIKDHLTYHRAFVTNVTVSVPVSY